MCNIFINLCKKGEIKKAQNMYNKNKINVHFKNESALKAAIENGYTDIVLWLLSLEDTPNIHIEKDIIFKSACKNVNLDMIKIIYKKYIEEINSENTEYYILINYPYPQFTKKNLDDLILNIFKSLHVDVIQLLLSLGYNINTSKFNNIFSILCYFGYLEVAKWLMTLDDKPNISANNDEAFRYACKNGHLEIAKWLMTLDNKPNIRANNDKAFRYACKNGHLEIAKWLMTLDEKPNIRVNNDEVFKFACSFRNRNINIAIWLSTLCHDYILDITNGNLYYWYIKNSLKNSLKILYNNKKYYEILDKLNIPISNFILNTENKCIICFSDNYNFLTSCKHTFCIECFLTWYISYDKKKCCYCMQNIEIEKCCYNSLLKCESQKKSYIYTIIDSLFNFYHICICIYILDIFIFAVSLIKN